MLLNLTHSYTHMCIHSNRQTRVAKNTPIRCSCNLSRSCSDPDVPSAWQLSCSSHSQPFLASRWYVCTYICVCEHKFAPVLWLMQDQSLTDPITRVCHARVASVWVMGKISSEMLLVSSILDHCGMLLSGKSLCDITHAYTQTHMCACTHIKTCTSTVKQKQICLDIFVYTIQSPNPLFSCVGKTTF